MFELVPQLLDLNDTFHLVEGPQKGYTKLMKAPMGETGATVDKHTAIAILTYKQQVSKDMYDESVTQEFRGQRST